MSFEEYRKIDALNNSTLTSFAKSPAHSQVEKPDTAAMKFGRDFHSYILELGLFRQSYVVAPKSMKFTTKVGKAWKKSQKREILSWDNAAHMINMAARLYSGDYEIARNLIEKSSREISIVWKSSKHDLLCKCRIDLICEDLGIIADVKTTTDANPANWLKKSINAGFNPHWQPAWYLEGANSVGFDKKFDTFLWIVFEVSPPYGISVIRATPAPAGQTDMVYLAQEQIKDLLPSYVEAKAKNKWQCYPDQIVDGELPTYYVRTAL
jgi:hypothetical protein